MRIAFHAVAEKETEEVAGYYDLQLPGLGAEFYHELCTILDLLEPNPWMGAVYSGPYRRVMLQRFPFAVYYEVSRQPDQDRGRRAPTQVAGILERP
jgi:hypothetical protein